MAVKFRDYYEVLGVPRRATADDIKKAFRSMARKHHPDLKPAGEREKAGEAFKEINEAYEVLSDPEKRRKYDELGQGWKSGAEFTPPPGTDRGTIDPSQWGDTGDFSDFFESIFGRGAGRSRRGAAREGVRFVIPGADIEAELPVAFDVLLRGGKRRITIDGGRNVDVDIPRGVRDGTALRLAGQGQQGDGGGPPGDLFLRLRLMPDPRYHVMGDDLEADLPLQPWQAALGAAVRLQTPDGPVSLKVPAGTQSGQRLRLRGRGLPKRDGAAGDLYALARIVVPEHLSGKETEAYEELKRLSTGEDEPAKGTS